MSDTPDASSATIDAALVPEDSRTFRMARLLLLLSTARHDGRRVESLDRLAYYEFFADNPWVVVDGDSTADDRDRDTLRLAGFARTQLSYASTGQRFASRRARIRADFAQLVAYELATLDGTQFRITDRGDATSNELQSSYAAAYRTSASVVLRRLVSLGQRALQKRVEEWLGQSWLLLDLLEDVRGADVPELPETAPNAASPSRTEEH